MDPHYLQWLNLVVRWIHVITGVAWIGASFYFNWLEGNLERKHTQGSDLEGDLWAVHGGGFYHVVKYKVAPGSLPSKLHWFKWEAYFTWISGFSLLCVVYYLGAKAYLIDPAVRDLTPAQAIGVGLAVLPLAWFVYDFLCESRLAARPVWFSTVFFGLATLLAYALCQMFSSRGAYIHVGAALGTIMAANVFRVIIPSQKALVEAMQKGQKPDGRIGKKALQRSLHNNYLTLPVLFIMISNHFPITYGNSRPWLILAALSLIGAGTRHYFNLKNRGERKVWILPVACLAMLCLAFVTKTSVPEAKDAHASESVNFLRVQQIVTTRCVSCHSSAPIDKDFTTAPNGVKFDSPQEIKDKADLIKTRVVLAKTMPLANRTQMTEEERQIIGAWIDAGAKLDL